MGRRTDYDFYNDNRVCDRLDSSFLPDSVRASVACSNNLRAATSSSSTEDVSVVLCSGECASFLSQLTGDGPSPAYLLADSDGCFLIYEVEASMDRIII